MFAWVEKYVIYLLLGLLVATAVFAGFQTLRLSWADTKMAKHLQEDFDAQAQAEKDARAKEEKAGNLAQTASEAYEQGKRDAQTTSTTLFADLAAQRQRLRPTWVCPAVGVPAAPSAPSEPSPAERDRDESASRIVAAAAECDAHVTALQHMYNDQRALINGR